MDAICIIPARLASKRLRRKLLLSAGGSTILEHTYRATCRASRPKFIGICTSDDEISDAAKSFDATVIRTGQHPNGTARIAEASRILARKKFRQLPIRPSTIIVNIQADEPLLNPADIDLLIHWMDRERDFHIATLAAPLPPDGRENPHVVKVWTDGKTPSPALDFSRKNHPWDNPLAHIGVYGFRYDALQDLAECGALKKENEENLEQIAWMVHYRILTIETDSAPRNINTKTDFEHFRQHITAKQTRPSGGEGE